MKTAMGTNVKVIVGEAARPRVRAMFEALGVTQRQELPEGIDIFVLDDGGNVAFFYGDALGEEDLSRAVWLELRVDALEEAEKALDALSIPRVEYVDKTHSYFRAPGGLVFRLAALG